MNVMSENRSESLVIVLMTMLIIVGIAYAINWAIATIHSDKNWTYTSSPAQLREAIRRCRIAHVERFHKTERVRCVSLKHKFEDDEKETEYE